MKAESCSLEADLAEDIEACVGCGLCLEACPTYMLSQHESQSPRGRIALFEAFLEGSLEPDEESRRPLDLCLGCRACETACPSGVAYGRILENGRAWLRGIPRPKRLSDVLLAGALRFIIPKAGMLRLAAISLFVAHMVGLIEVLRQLSFLPDAWRNMLALVPDPPTRSYSRRDRRLLGGRAESALFLGCVQEVLFPEVHEATASLLEASKWSVVHPRGQTCCGALHLHNGRLEEARDLARCNIDAFEESSSKSGAVIVVNAAGCGAVLKEYGDLLKGDDAYRERARRFSERVRDWSEVVTLEAVGKTRGEPVSVLYQDACHLAHAQSIRQQPRDLLAASPGLSLMELSDGGFCCGSAGIYNLLEAEVANSLRKRKVRAIEQSRATVLVSSNPGCLLHLRAGFRATGARRMKTLHPASLLYSRQVKV